jgi:hypothetical protein
MINLNLKTKNKNFIKKNIIFILFIFIFLIFNLNIINCSEIKDDFKIILKYPIQINLDSDYEIYPDIINIRDQDDFEIYAGQTIISKYDFNNKLNYNLEIVFNLNQDVDFIEEYSDVLDIYIMQDVEKKSDCINSREIYKFNNQEIYIEKDNTKKYLCYNKNSEDLKINLELEPGINSIYLLFISKPNLKNKNTKELNFNTILEINSENIDFTSKLSNTLNENFDSNSTLLNKANSSVDKLNSNYNNNSNDNINDNNINDNNSTLFDINKTKQTFLDIKDNAENLKSGATGLVTLGFSNIGIIIGGLILVILFSLFITNKSKKKKEEFRDLDSL